MTQVVISPGGFATPRRARPQRAVRPSSSAQVGSQRWVSRTTSPRGRVVISPGGFATRGCCGWCRVRRRVVISPGGFATRTPGRLMAAWGPQSSSAQVGSQRIGEDPPGSNTKSSSAQVGSQLEPTPTAGWTTAESSSAQVGSQRLYVLDPEGHVWGRHQPRWVRNKNRATSARWRSRVVISPGGLATRPQPRLRLPQLGVVISPGGLATSRMARSRTTTGARRHQPRWARNVATRCESRGGDPCRHQPRWARNYSGARENVHRDSSSSSAQVGSQRLRCPRSIRER